MRPPEPRANPILAGHEAAAETLEAAARGARLHHAWLLAGDSGIGKATLAFRFARWLFAGAPRGRAPLELPATHPAFQRVASGGHADLAVLAPQVAEGRVQKIINVEEARAVPRFLTMTPAEGGWRIVIVDNADSMNNQAQNALLKTLEEPPPRAVLLLTSAAPDRLLPTIRSRCRRLDLYPLPQPTLEALLAGWLPELGTAERAHLARIAEGSPGQALALAEGEGLELQREVEAVLAALPAPRPQALHQLADRIAAKRDGTAFVTFMLLLRRAIAHAVREAARGGALAPWLAGRALADWVGLWETLGRIAEETEGLTLDRKQAVLSGVGLLSSRPG